MELTSDEKDRNCDGVKKVVSGLKICVDAKMVSRVIDVEDEGTEVRSPSPCNCGTADDILQDDVACPNERPEITKLHSQVRERSACNLSKELLSFLTDTEEDSHIYLTWILVSNLFELLSCNIVLFTSQK